jgi:hypothetical protein
MFLGKTGAFSGVLFTDMSIGYVVQVVYFVMFAIFTTRQKGALVGVGGGVRTGHIPDKLRFAEAEVDWAQVWHTSIMRWRMVILCKCARAERW